LNLGLQGVFLNLKGREKDGAVEPKEAPALLKEIQRKLRVWKDKGRPVVQDAAISSELYKGPYAEGAPDMVVGYSPGHRASWQTALGAAPKALVEDNMKRWSGDHSMHPDAVPGVLFSSRKIEAESPAIVDAAPTILKYFGLQEPAERAEVNEEMDGRAFF